MISTRQVRPFALAALSLALAASCVQAQSTQPATSDLDADKGSVITEGIVAAPISEVWRVFSTPEGYTRLGVARAKMDFRAGGVIWSSYDPKAELGGEGSIGQEILAIDPGRMLALHIVHPPKGFPFLEACKTVTTTISLTDLGDGRTHVRLCMNGYTGSDESQKMRGFFRTGNAFVLKKLQSAYADAAQAPIGAAHAEDPRGPIDISQLVKAPRADVYKLYTSKEGWKAFFNQDSTIGTTLGDPFVPFKGTEGNTILSAVPGEMFSHTWNAPPQFAFAKTRHSWVVLHFDEVSPGLTRVRMHHDGFADLAAANPDHAKEFEDSRAYFASKWPLVLGAIAKHFEDIGAPAAPAR